MRTLAFKYFKSFTLASALLLGVMSVGGQNAAAQTPPNVETVTFAQSGNEMAPNVMTLEMGSPSIVVTAPNAIRVGQIFEVGISLKTLPDGVAAEKFVIEFNSKFFDFVDALAADVNTNIAGQYAESGRVTVIATQLTGSVAPDVPIIHLLFKAKAESGIDDLKVGVELGIAGNGLIDSTPQRLFNIQVAGGMAGDLNGNGMVDIGDLAMLTVYFGIDSQHPDWGVVVNADFNQNGVLDLIDLATVAKKVLYGNNRPFELMEASIMGIQQAMEAGKLTAVELITQYLARINSYDKKGPSINSLITINSHALEIAAELDLERQTKGPRGPLHGIPVIVKDNFNTVGMPTTGGCICLKDSYAPTDAFMVKKLKDAGAIIIAKSNLHEFAFGTTTLSSLGGQTKNPYDLTKNPGGSSGGTGAALAANFGVLGLGTDTGGSIRIPASFNSVVGIRPTIGLTSRAGIMPLALSQDVGGPMARTVADAAIMLDVVSGYDPEDIMTAYSVGQIPESYTSYLDKNGLKGARIGVIRALVTSSNDVVRTMTDRAIQDMRRMGAEVIDVVVPDLNQILNYPSLSGIEFKFNFNDYLAALGDNAPYKTLSEIIDSNLYLQNQKSSMIQRNNVEFLETESYKDILLFRTRLTQQSLLKVMAEHKLDALMYPTTAGPAGGSGGNANRLSPFSGFPAISVPAGFTASTDLPAGIEFLGRPFDEPTLIKLAYAYEQGTKHRKMPLTTPVLPLSAVTIEQPVLTP